MTALQRMQRAIENQMPSKPHFHRLTRMVDVSGKVQGAIGIVVITIALLAMTPVVVNQVQAVNTSNWTFTGAEGAKALLGLVPFVWVAGILMSAVVAMYLLAKGGK